MAIIFGIQQNKSRQNDTEQNDIQQNEILFKDTWQNNILLNATQQTDIQQNNYIKNDLKPIRKYTMLFQSAKILLLWVHCITHNKGLIVTISINDKGL